MFVKIERGRHSTLYECDELYVENAPSAVLLTMGQYGHAEADRVIEVSKEVDERVGVYAMNENGRTIDTVFQKAEAGE